MVAEAMEHMGPHTRNRYNALMNDLRYRGPVIEADGLKLDSFTVEDGMFNGQPSLEMIKLQIEGRAPENGVYHRLAMDGEIWMSDTTAERRDHLDPVLEAANFREFRKEPGRGLVNGLGLGIVVGAMLEYLEHVDVVEKDERVVQHIGSWYAKQYGDRVTIYHGDALRMKWPPNMWWDVAWHDIWPSIGMRWLPQMNRLHRMYGRRVGWQGSWARTLAEMERDGTLPARFQIFS